MLSNQTVNHQNLPYDEDFVPFDIEFDDSIALEVSEEEYAELIRSEQFEKTSAMVRKSMLRLLTEFEQELEVNSEEYQKLQAMKAKVFYDDEFFNGILARGMIDLAASLPGALGMTALSYWAVGTGGHHVLLAAMLTFEVFSIGIGGVSSLWRAVYFMATMGIPGALNKDLDRNEKRIRMIGSLSTSWDGGWLISPFVRFAITNPAMRQALFWKLASKVKQTKDSLRGGYVWLMNKLGASIEA